MFNPELIEAYRNAAFVVDGPDGEIVLRVGQTSQEIDNLLSTYGVAECAFVTAWNPRSVRLEVNQNSLRHSELIERVCQLGYHFFSGRGIGENKAWTPEESVLVLGIGQRLALDLGRSFGQNAIIFKVISRPVELLFCA
jgi:hypothetical protein